MQKKITKEEAIPDSNALLAEIKELREKMSLIEESFKKVSTYQKQKEQTKAEQDETFVPVHAIAPISLKKSLALYRVTSQKTQKEIFIPALVEYMDRHPV